MGSKRSKAVARWHADRVYMGRRCSKLVAATEFIRIDKQGWGSAWRLPWGGASFWSSVWDHVTRSVSSALGRWAHVVMVRDIDLTSSTTVRLHAPWTRSVTTQHEKVIHGDVVVIHNNMDVLLVSCSDEINDALRSTLGARGYQAAARVCGDAEVIQQGGVVLDWITNMNKECNNPADLGHKSPGVTVDWGLHDGQTTYAVMLSTEIGKRGALPPSTHTLRSSVYEAHRDACTAVLSHNECKHFARKRLSSHERGQTSRHVMLPSMRLTSSPKIDDTPARDATRFEGVCRSSASDISNHFFGALPGVRALNAVQAALKWGEAAWSTSHMEGTCPFRGGSEYLYTKGSISQQGTKTWHDDANGPACLTCWQNLGTVANEQLELVVAVNGCRVVMEANMGKVVLFMGWLPHRTQMRTPEGSVHDMTTAVRLHHTAYVRFGTEYAANTISEYRRRRLPLRGYVTR